MAIQSTLIPTSSGDPVTDASGTQLYAKAGGLFTRSPAGVVAQIGSGGSPIIASTVLGSPASTISVSGLDGDADLEYAIELNYIATGVSSHDVDVRPNGGTGADRASNFQLGNTVLTSTSGIIMANGAVTAAVQCRIDILFFATRTGGYWRRMFSRSMGTHGTSPVNTFKWEGDTVYASNAANITSFAAGITNVQFATGSELIVRRRVR